MDTLQCAIVLAKLNRFEWEIEQRQIIGGRYNALLDERGIERVVQKDDRTSVFAQYTVFVDDRDKVQADLQQAGIPTAVHYPVPLNEQPAYSGRCVHPPLPASKQVSGRVLSLPMHPDLAEETQDRIVAVLAGAV